MERSPELVMARASERWRDILGWSGRSKTSRQAIDIELSTLIAAYTAPSRHYHDLRHIDALLQLSLDHRSRLTDPTAVDLAIFYHDAVYEAARSDNEEASAGLARIGLAHLGLRASALDKVARYIEATKHVGAAASTAAGADADLDHLLDFDLSVLAAAEATYDAYAAAIRREYAIFPDTAYRAGRAKVLRNLLGEQALYRVPALAAAWEARARANLQRELSSIDHQ